MIESGDFLNLPYDLFSIDLGETQFVLQFLNFHEQDDYSIRMGGLSGDFGISYRDKAFSCAFGCDITVGNVYDFYQRLARKPPPLRRGMNCVPPIDKSLQI